MKLLSFNSLFNYPYILNWASLSQSEWILTTVLSSTFY